MSRPDLGSHFDGWQVCDPTPQETSDGKLVVIHRVSSHVSRPVVGCAFHSQVTFNPTQIKTVNYNN